MIHSENVYQFMVRSIFLHWGLLMFCGLINLFLYIFFLLGLVELIEIPILVAYVLAGLIGCHFAYFIIEGAYQTLTADKRTKINIEAFMTRFCNLK